MTAHEKAVAALNRRVERLQASLREADEETARQFSVQAIVVTIGLGEALSDYIKGVSAYAQSRHGELKQENEALSTRHADVLEGAKGLLEKLKAAPTDRALRKEIDAAQQTMASIQKSLRRGANALQRDVAPSIAAIDKLALSIARLADADASDALKRVLKTIIAHLLELYAAQPSLPAKGLIDAKSWEASALAQIEEAAGPHDAYARAAYQTLLALDLARMAVSTTPPTTPDDAIARSNESVATRVKAITVRLAGAN